MLKIALLGCGRIAQRHAAVLHDQVVGAGLCAVCDIIPEKAKALGEKYSVPYFTDEIDMVLQIHPDVVSILTQSGRHVQNTLLMAGLNIPNILIEKPIGLNLENIMASVDYCEGWRSLSTVHQNRYNLPVIQLKSAIDSHRLGKINVATVRVRWRRDQSYYSDWHGTWADAGGVLANQAIHHVDLLRWLCGPVDTVFAYATTAMVSAEVEDTLVAALKFSSGALGTIECTTAARPINLEGSLSILGEHGTVEIGGFAVNKMLHWEFEDAQPGDIDIATLCENPPDVYGFGHKAFYQDYVNAIEVGNPPSVSWQDGYNAVELVRAIYESVEIGKEVKVGDPTPHVRLGRVE